jgi:hypothetical protein
MNGVGGPARFGRPAGLAMLPELAREGDVVELEIKEGSNVSPLVVVDAGGHVLAKLEHNGQSVAFINNPSWLQRLVARVLRRPVAARWQKIEDP